MSRPESISLKGSKWAPGIVEIILDLSLLALGRYRVQLGWIVAAFFTAIFPGKVFQLVTHTDP